MPLTITVLGCNQRWWVSTLRYFSFWPIAGLFLSGVYTGVFASGLEFYTAHSINLGKFDLTHWKGPKPSVPGFYPVGFSKDGWFAYVNNPSGDEITDEGASCATPPCHDGVSLINLDCSHEGCVSDAPAFRGDKCWCPIGFRVNDLTQFGIEPVGRIVHGVFPFAIDGDEYSIKIIFKEKLILSEASLRIDPKTKQILPESMEAGTQVLFVSKKRGSKLIRTIANEHEGIQKGNIQPVAWIKDPFHQRVVIVVGYVDSGIPASVTFIPIGADLTSGFIKKEKEVYE